MTTISAETILRSRNAAAPDHVLSTLLLRYPRFIHAELMTHRAFSRNAASSRAIPFEKQVEAMLADPAIPVHWGKNQKGMRADEELTAGQVESAVSWWDDAMHAALGHARKLHELGLHKALVNRLIEPFTHITVLVSATEWDNFLELRDHEDAEPHIRMLAREIRKCLEREDNIQTLQPGEWHLPFADAEDDFHQASRYLQNSPILATVPVTPIDLLLRGSVARCASTSYKTVDGFDMTLDRAIALHDKLVSSTPIHASPAEHVAQADERTADSVGWGASHLHGNFVGFCQYRHMLEN